MMRTLGGVVAVAALTIGCARVERDRATLQIPGRTNAHVSLASEGARVAAVWAVSGSGGADIYFASSVDRGRDFGSPVRVNDVAGEASVSGEQPPRVVVRGSTVNVLWVAKVGSVSAIRTATSNDAGATFTAARTITPAGINGARGWESAAVADDGAVHVAWLDGRSAAAQGGHHHHDSSPRQDVFHAMLTGLNATSESRVAANVCFCCKTAIATHANAVYVAWRHLFDGSIRDIAVASSADGGRTFGQPVRVSDDNWKLDACPDDGPAMAFDTRGMLHVVWPTLVRDPDKQRMAIFHASSRDGGATFSPRERVDGERRTNPSHPRIAAGADGGVVIVWDEMADSSRHVMGRLWGATPGQVQVLDRGTASSYPFVVATDAEYLAAWTEQDTSGSRIIVGRIF